MVSAIGFSNITQAKTDDVAALERRVAELNRELERTRQELATAKTEADASRQKATRAEAELAASPQPESKKFQVGPLSIGGAMRVNYVLGSYTNGDSGPNRGGNGGNVELDTFRINLALDYENIVGELEYRWYPAGAGKNYNFLHTGWLGYRFEDGSHVEVGVNRVPFGPGPYGVSQSWFFDQHYYVGLADDMDLGVKYVTEVGNWTLDAAFYAASEGNWFGRSDDSARYSYDAVKWRESIDEDGNVTYGGPVNGYAERNQFNIRAIYHLDDTSVPTDLGISVQYGQLKGKGTDDGSHWAASAHMVNQIGKLKIASQITRYEIDVDADNPWGTDTLIPMGAYDFAWPVATKHGSRPFRSATRLTHHKSAGWTTSCPTSNTAASSRTRTASTTARCGRWAPLGRAAAGTSTATWPIPPETISSATTETTTQISSTAGSATSASPATTSGITASISILATTSDQVNP